MFFKFNTKKEAFDFIMEVNEGENIKPTLDNTTTSYAQPFALHGVFYVIADDVTRKYSDAEEFDPFAPVDTTPPTMSGNLVAIPPQFEWVFRNDKFEINGFVVEFIRTPDDILAVDIAYLQWEAFIAELDKPENATVKNSLEPIWDYVLKQNNNGNFI
jgi:hypothetical protein